MDDKAVHIQPHLGLNCILARLLSVGFTVRLFKFDPFGISDKQDLMSTMRTEIKLKRQITLIAIGPDPEGIELE